MTTADKLRKILRDYHEVKSITVYMTPAQADYLAIHLLSLEPIPVNLQLREIFKIDKEENPNA